jgi:hypothetical protein
MALTKIGSWFGWAVSLKKLSPWTWSSFSAKASAGETRNRAGTPCRPISLNVTVPGMSKLLGGSGSCEPGFAPADIWGLPRTSTLPLKPASKVAMSMGPPAGSAAIWTFVPFPR